MEENKEKSGNVMLIIIGIFFFLGLIFLGIYVDGVSSIIALVFLGSVLHFFYKIEKSKNNGISTLILVMIFLFAPISAFVDLRGNPIYNFAVQRIYCGNESSFQTEVKQTQSFGTKKAVNFSFACVGQKEEVKEVSSFLVFAIRWVEYLFIGLLLIAIIGIISKIHGGVVNEN